MYGSSRSFKIAPKASTMVLLKSTFSSGEPSAILTALSMDSTIRAASRCLFTDFLKLFSGVLCSVLISCSLSLFSSIFRRSKQALTSASELMMVSIKNDQVSGLSVQTENKCVHRYPPLLKRRTTRRTHRGIGSRRRMSGSRCAPPPVARRGSILGKLSAAQAIHGGTHDGKSDRKG